MKIRIEIDPELAETEVAIKCAAIDEEVLKLQSELLMQGQETKKLIFYKGDTEYFLPIEEILFFETSDNEVWAHTKEDEYKVLHKLYELEEILPGYFSRISKSSILNTRKVYSIVRNLTASSKVEFMGSYKVVYVSRSYYKSLKEKITALLD